MTDVGFRMTLIKKRDGRRAPIDLDMTLIKKRDGQGAPNDLNQK